MKRVSIRTEIQTVLGVLDQKANGTPYVFREGRHFFDPPQKVLEWCSGSRLENSYKAKRQAVLRS